MGRRLGLEVKGISWSRRAASWGPGWLPGADGKVQDGGREIAQQRQMLWLGREWQGGLA